MKYFNSKLKLEHFILKSVNHVTFIQNYITLLGVKK
jgi:hypothetical protein